MQDGQRKIPAIHRARREERVRLGLTPAFLDPTACVGWQLAIVDLVIRHRKTLATLFESPICQPVRWPRHDPIHQISAVIRQVSRRVTRAIKRAQNINRSRRRIQPNAIRQPSIFVGIIRQHQRHFAIRVRRCRQFRPIRRQFSHKRDPPTVSAVA